MIKVKIGGQVLEGKKFNGLEVFLDVTESDGEKCDQCKRDGEPVIMREFEIVKMRRGAVQLQMHTHFFREVAKFINERMGHGHSLCHDCFEKRMDDKLGGYESADE
jgi:hypothetical protein